LFPAGAWSNPISPDQNERETAIDKCIKSLHLADEKGAFLLCKYQWFKKQKILGRTTSDNLTGRIKCGIYRYKNRFKRLNLDY